MENNFRSIESFDKPQEGQIYNIINLPFLWLIKRLYTSKIIFHNHQILTKNKLKVKTGFY